MVAASAATMTSAAEDCNLTNCPFAAGRRSEQQCHFGGKAAPTTRGSLRSTGYCIERIERANRLRRLDTSGLHARRRNEPGSD